MLLSKSLLSFLLVSFLLPGVLLGKPDLNRRKFLDKDFLKLPDLKTPLTLPPEAVIKTPKELKQYIGGIKKRIHKSKNQVLEKEKNRIIWIARTARADVAADAVNLLVELLNGPGLTIATTHLNAIIERGNPEIAGPAIRIADELDRKEVLPSVLKILKPTFQRDPDHPHYGLIGAIVEFLESNEVESEKFLPAYASLGLMLLNQKPSGLHKKRLELFEYLRARLTRSQVKFDQMVRHLAMKHNRESAKGLEPCKVLCALVDKRAKWGTEAYFLHAEFLEDSFSWEFAQRSLTALFMAKAAKYCPKAKQYVKEMLSYWRSSQRMDHENAFEARLKKSHEEARADRKRLGELLLTPLLKELKDAQVKRDQRNAERILTQIISIRRLTETTVPRNSSTVYGKQFHSLLLRELLKVVPIGDSQAMQLGLELRATERSLRGDIGRFKSALVGNSGSLFSTYAYSTSVLSLASDEKSTARLKDMLSMLTDKMVVPYSPLLKGEKPPVENAATLSEESRRSSSARAVPFHLSLYLRSTGKSKADQRKYLSDAVENYLTHAPSLMGNVGRNSTHLGTDGLAPYYYYSTIPYTVSAMQLLKSRSKSVEEIKKLEEQQEELKLGLLSMLMTDGLFRPQGRDEPIRLHGNLPPVVVDRGAPQSYFSGGNTYPSSPGYVNPLAGLALVGMVERCNGKKVPGSVGIVELDLESRRSFPEIWRDASRPNEAHHLSK